MIIPPEVVLMEKAAADVIWSRLPWMRPESIDGFAAQVVAAISGAAAKIQEQREEKGKK